MFVSSAISKADLGATSIDHAAGIELADHAHDEGQVSIVLRGTMTLHSEDGWWLVPAGLAMWIPPGIVHGAHFSESASLIHLRLPGHRTRSLQPSCTPVVVTELLRALAFEALRLQGGTDQADATDLVSRLLVLQLGQPRQGPGLYLPHGRDRRLQLATALLRGDPGGKLTLDELAHRTHTSSRTLARLFINETGMPFTRWRDHLRLLAAVDRLARRQSITQTALDLGYRSTSSFTNFFTRLVGAPPRRYMQQLMRQQHPGDRAPGDCGAS